jgi:hypothetical protein
MADWLPDAPNHEHERSQGRALLLPLLKSLDEMVELERNRYR